VVGKRVRPKERVGFGEPVVVRDQPGILVVEESHFPAWLWWSLWIAYCFGVIGIGGGLSSWWLVLVGLACFSVTMLPMMLAVSLIGYQRLSIRDGEAITATRVQHIGRGKPKRIAMSAIDFLSLDRETIIAPDRSTSDGLIVTAYMKDGSSQVLAELPYCEKVVSALKKHLPGLLAADGQSEVVPP